MKIIFQLYCETIWGQEVYIYFPLKEDDCPESIKTLVKMDYTENFIWTKEFSISNTEHLQFDYTYLIKDENNTKTKEGIRKRNFSLDREYTSMSKKENFTVIIKDSWIKQSDPLSLYYTSFFKDILAGVQKNVEKKHEQGNESIKNSERLIKFRVYVPWINLDSKIAIVGNLEEFGCWDIHKSREMKQEEKGLWYLEAITDKTIHLDYKYIIKDKTKSDVIWEQGNNRHVDVSIGDLVIINDGVFRYRDLWRGAGICIPVFSIRTKKGLGTGEFSDLKPLADWASHVGFRVIQILPVNDTTRQHSWTDAFPYSCISAFALHPLYLNIEEIGDMPEDLRQEFFKKRDELNSFDNLEYEMVMSAKMYFARRLFELDNMKFLESEAFHIFLQKNAFWLKPYALFCALRDRYKTGNYTKWGAYKNISTSEVERLVSRESQYYRDVCFYYFIQYHLYHQLFDASQYAKSKGIALKGDIPIGLHPESHEIWVHPELFHVDKSAGAPPDAFSEHGQNWGFPTYNWVKMAEDQYLWWRKRLENISQFFQLVRLDHILGFFRIWEIPRGMYSGMLGMFNPAIPLTEEELKREGIKDIDRLCEPYITQSIIKEIFGDWQQYIKDNFLVLTDNGSYQLKPEFSNQEKIDTFLNALEEKHMPVDKNLLRDGLFKLISNRIFLKDEKNRLHFRFNMMHTLSFKSLEKGQQDKLIAMYNDYFYRRQDSLWRENGMTKLPILKRASDMLICGEDLGMIPDCVQPVMEELCILGLRIQRMPKESDREFGDPSCYPYLTVCMTSTHDMPTLRGWWMEDREKTARFYRHVLNHNEEPPEECNGEIVKEIILQHLNSTSMLAIFPVQDLFAMNDNLKWKGNPFDEQINNPANPYHRWKYRMHITLEELVTQREFDDMIKDMIKRSFR